MAGKITLLGKTFGIYCSTHPNEFHDTLSFKETADKNVAINLDIRLDTDEWCNYLWEVQIDYLIKFEKNINETHTAVIREKDNLLAMKLVNEKIYFKINIAATDESNGIYSNYWMEIQEKK